MILVKNKLIPFNGFKAINIFGIVFYKGQRPSAAALNHEAIHSAQGRELLWLPFYVIYLLEFIIRLVLTLSFKEAYRSISFEQEARIYQAFDDYLPVRTHYYWINFL